VHASVHASPMSVHVSLDMLHRPCPPPTATWADMTLVSHLVSLHGMTRVSHLVSLHGMTRVSHLVSLHGMTRVSYLVFLTRIVTGWCTAGIVTEHVIETHLSGLADGDVGGAAQVLARDALHGRRHRRREHEGLPVPASGVYSRVCTACTLDCRIECAVECTVSVQ
jgi:hypothetical protein